MKRLAIGDFRLAIAAVISFFFVSCASASLPPIWSGPHVSLAIKKSSLNPNSKIENRQFLYDLNDVTLHGNAKTFLRTHEIIFWLKGSVVF